MKTGFMHSVKVPRIYKETSKIVAQVKEQGASLKQLLFQKKHPNLKGIFALALSVIKHSEHLDFLIRKTRILTENQRLDPWLARVLITELLWGKQKLPAGCKPIDTVLGYEKQLRAEADSVLTNEDFTNERQVRKPRYVRVNTLKTTVDREIATLEAEGWEFVQVEDNYKSYLKTLDNLQERQFVQDIHIPELLAFPPGTEFHTYSGYKDGFIVLQDKASCLPSFLLNATPGSVVLDMCAAPGMKTTHLSAIMQNQGKIYAVEQHGERFKTLNEMVAKMYCFCVNTINADSLQLDETRCPDVEYILVDPSCSGSGMVDRLIVGKNEQCPPHRITKLQSFQVLILTHALLGFPAVKRVVYSTCSINPEENEQVVDEVLSKVGDAYKLLPVKKLLKNKWNNFSSADYKCADNCLYARPDEDKTNGFFVAVFERNPEVALPPHVNRRIPKAKNKWSKKTETENSETENGDDVAQTEKRGKKRKNKQRQEKDSEINEEVGADKEKSSGDLHAEEEMNTDVSNPPKTKAKKKKKQKSEASEDRTEDMEMLVSSSNHEPDEQNYSEKQEVTLESPVKKKKKKKSSRQS